jgi:hypothetical protein
MIDSRILERAMFFFFEPGFVVLRIPVPVEILVGKIAQYTVGKLYIPTVPVKALKAFLAWQKARCKVITKYCLPNPFESFWILPREKVQETEEKALSFLSAWSARLVDLQEIRDRYKREVRQDAVEMAVALWHKQRVPVDTRKSVQYRVDRLLDAAFSKPLLSYKPTYSVCEIRAVGDDSYLYEYVCSSYQRAISDIAKDLSPQKFSIWSSWMNVFRDEEVKKVLDNLPSTEDTTDGAEGVLRLMLQRKDENVPPPVVRT